jgi:hypothetical protein
LSGDQARRGATKEGKRIDVGLGPGLLIHDQDWANEHVPRAGQHQHERPHRPPTLGVGITPHPKPAVVDLALRPGLDVVRAQPRTWSRRACSGRLARTQRRRLATEASKPCSSRSRWWIVAAVTPASSWSWT